MAGYFSFHKMITTPFVKVLYFVGFIALTAAGIGLAAWAAMGLRSTALPTRLGLYYIAIGLAALTIGNLAWRAICELWIVLFNIHTLLASVGPEMKTNYRHNELATEDIQPEARYEKVQSEQKSETVKPDKQPYGVTRPASVLGLS